MSGKKFPVRACGDLLASRGEHGLQKDEGGGEGGPEAELEDEVVQLPGSCCASYQLPDPVSPCRCGQA